MSYNTTKGKRGEYEFSDFLTKIFKKWNYRFRRIGNPEKNKFSLFGDVVVDNEKCFLRKYFLEAKNHADPDLWSIMREAEQNARNYNKWGVIAYVIKSGKPKTGGERLIVMSPQTFEKIVVELQGYLNNE